MGFSSNNMNYIFNTEYFSGIDLMKDKDADNNTIDARNNDICDFNYPQYTLLSQLRDEPGYTSFTLFTSYPGLLIGTGYPHQIAVKNALKCGFSFDYVTGLPYLPGSSLKGMLRSCFEEHEFIRGITGFEDVEALENSIFENGDIFIGVYPSEGGKMLNMEYITPHKDPLENPIPISLIKVRPGVPFEFAFILSDSEDLTKDKKAELFKKLICGMGIGAKTNVGFGRMVVEKLADNNISETAKEYMPSESKTSHAGAGRTDAKQNGDKNILGKCPNCGEDIIVNQYGRWFCKGKCGIRLFPDIFG
ncbi:MAG: type III-B CRISPR module RAMP protein Cmr6, partial [Clostridia bacterium]|nr:type III-B CRISPR module RAMP protein Cmr6 [Clostridia bacterium]